MSISAQAVKELREKTAAGMMDCKKALEEAGGDMEKAVDWLRQKGLSKAAKKSGRTTSEGLIGCQVAADGKEAVLLEIRCETDFVSRGDKFRDVVQTCTRDFFDFGKDAPDAGAMEAKLADAVVTLGENIALGQASRLKLDGPGFIGSYVHANGKIGVLVRLGCDKDATVQAKPFAELARNLAMQIAAASPLAVSSENLDPALIEREREIYRQKARDDGKAENIIDKIADGAVKKYFKETCLLEQPYIRDDKLAVGGLIQQVGKEVGDTLSVKGFVRLQLGAA
jgi:elongation factor Ts